MHIYERKTLTSGWADKLKSKHFKILLKVLKKKGKTYSDQLCQYKLMIYIFIRIFLNNEVFLIERAVNHYKNF